MRFLLLHTASWAPDVVAGALRAEQIETRALTQQFDPRADDRPMVLVLDPPARRTVAAATRAAFREAGGVIVALGAAGEDDVPADLAEEELSGFVRHPAGGRQLLLVLKAAFREAVARREAAVRTSELHELTDIGVKLSTEKNYNSLLDQILFQARRITRSDAGSLYLVEADEEGLKRLRFKLTQNDSRPDIPFVEFTMPINHASLAGYAAATGGPLVIEDVYAIGAEVAYSFNRSFDERYGYRTKSMLVIPMQNHAGEVIGVVQLINGKRAETDRLATPADTERLVLPYSPHLVELVKSLAGQAAVALENSQLYEEIERLFEGFVRAAVTAIEQRDPTTSGHSERVANLTVGLAKAVDRSGEGQYSLIRFSAEQVREIRYAGLLHDFGKVGVREKVLVKENKLYPYDFARIQERHDFMLRSLQWQYEKARADFLTAHGNAGYPEFLRDLDERFAGERGSLERFLSVVTESNRPTILAEGNFEALHEFAGLSFDTIAGQTQAWLSPEEVRYLSIRKGTLDEGERREIESHVRHTFDFLRDIPWTRNLSGVPGIAHGHHEKLDGSGYPRGIRAPDIPIQTRMMTISDIYDALTAKDRPYKRAVPVDRALDIMHSEVNAGMLDSELFQLFIAAKVFEDTD